VSVSGSYTGADAQTVEQTVAIPIEEQVNGTPGMEYMQSTNTNSGGMNIRVTFNIGTNVYISALNVQNRVGIAQPLLPSVVSALGLTVRASNPDQLMLVAIYAPNGSHNITFLDNYTNVFVEDAILRVPGVGDVQARTDQFAMRIWMNPDKMASYNITPSDVSNALNAQNAYVAAGAAGAPPQLSSQSHEIGILVNGMLSKPEDYEDELSFEIDDLLPLVDAAVMLGLARVHNAQLEITDQGREFAEADIDASKKLFGELIAERAPLIKAILRALHATNDGTLREGFFLDLLRRGFSADEARRQLDIAIDWGRYGELFEYDAESGELVLGSDPAAVGA
jgi:hypothetical protein